MLFRNCCVLGGAQASILWRWVTIPLTWIALLLSAVVFMSHSAAASVYGDGSDGALVVNGTVGLAADRNFTDLTITATGTLQTNGFTVRVLGTLTNLGTITDPSSGGAGGNGGTGGAGGIGFAGHTSPVQGSAGFSGGPPSVSGAGFGGKGGSGGGGGGGAWDAVNAEMANGGMGGTGGQGGKGGGYVRIFALNFDNQGTIHADAQNGSSGGFGLQGMYTSYVEPPFTNRDMAGGGGGGGAGGNGGNGGSVNITYGNPINLGTTHAFGGTGGSAGFGASGRNTSESAGPNQQEENGASSSGTPAGGTGGRSEVGSASSDPGGNGLPGNPGSNGSVIRTQGPTTCCNTDGTRGNVDNLTGVGGEVDVADLTFLVAYLFQGGSPSPCLDEGNVDGIVGVGGPIDVADLTSLVGYLFQGGALPAPCP